MVGDSRKGRKEKKIEYNMWDGTTFFDGKVFKLTLNTVKYFLPILEYLLL